MEYIIAHTTIAFDLFALIAAIIFIVTTAVCIMRMHELKETRRGLQAQLENSETAAISAAAPAICAGTAAAAVHAAAATPAGESALPTEATFPAAA